ETIKMSDLFNNPQSPIKIMFDDLVLLFALLKNESMVKAEARGCEPSDDTPGIFRIRIRAHLRCSAVV
ncbi:MAG: hypothetical protein ACYTCV_10730, partial [Planctomycetota bacterium]